MVSLLASVSLADLVPPMEQVPVQAEPAEAVSNSPPALMPTTGKKKLDRKTKIELMFVLISILAVGLVLIAFTWLTARLTRRYMRPLEKMPQRSLDPVFTDDWASKPLTPQERERLDSEEW
jgi:hypothetical protein